MAPPLAARERGGHSSWAHVATRLTQPTRTTDPETALEGLPLAPSLFGLAPGGVYRAAPVARRAVGSYPTLSPLPATPATFGSRMPVAVCFLWHFPWGRPRRPLTGTVSPWSPDFPHPRPFGFAGAAARPAGKAYKGVRARKRKRKSTVFAVRERVSKRGHLHLDLAAIGGRHRVHPPGGVAGIVFQDRAAGRAAAELCAMARYFMPYLMLVSGSKSPLTEPLIAHHPRRRRLDLHQADLAGAADHVRPVVAFDLDDGLGKRHRHTVARRHSAR